MYYVYMLLLTVNVSGFTFHLFPGAPSPPINLHIISLNKTLSAMAEWDPPTYCGGNGITIKKYRITISERNYSIIVEENEVARSHIIIADGVDVIPNMFYTIEVTAINTCNSESDAEQSFMQIRAIGKSVFAIY